MVVNTLHEIYGSAVGCRYKDPRQSAYREHDARCAFFFCLHYFQLNLAEEAPCIIPSASAPPFPLALTFSHFQRKEALVVDRRSGLLHIVGQRVSEVFQPQQGVLGRWSLILLALEIQEKKTKSEIESERPERFTTSAKPVTSIVIIVTNRAALNVLYGDSTQRARSRYLPSLLPGCRHAKKYPLARDNFFPREHRIA